MKRVRVYVLCVGIVVLALVPILAAVMPGPTRVGPAETTPAPQVQSLTWANPRPLAPTFVQYGPPPSSGATAEIISRAGEILGAMNNPDRRSQLAEQWLQFSKETIAKDQEFRDDWLHLQRQQLAQQEEAGQLHLQIAQLQAQIEELRAQNLRQEQENLQIRQQLGLGTNPQGPRTPAPAPSPQPPGS